MRYIAVCILLALTASQALAEQVSLRSGDHPAFTRLVLSIAAESAWSLRKSPDGYALEVDGATDYDSEDVFARISRNRIADLRANQTRLDILVDCDCHADAFLFRPDRLVVDIIDGPAPQDSEFEQPLDDVAPPESGASVPESYLAGAILPLLPGGPLRPLELTPTEEPQLPPQPTVADPGLAAAIDAAAGAGLLTPAADVPPLPDAGELQPDGSVPGLASMSGLQSDPRRGIAAANTPCPDPAWYNVPLWEDPGIAFLEELAAIRQTFPADGRPTTTDRLGFARFLVAHGMGREAAQIVDGSTPEAELVLRMAGLLDGGTESLEAPIGWRACAAQVILWESALQGDLSDLRSDQVEDLLSAFLILPPPVAGRIGPRLALALAETRHFEAADAILARFLESSWADSRELARVEARIDRLVGAPERAIRGLTDLNDTEGLDPAGYIELVQLQLETGAEVPPDLLELGEILVRESRGSPTAGHLARVLSLAQMATGNDARALSLFEESRGDLAAVAPELPAILHRDLMVDLAETGSDAVFLEVAFETAPDDLDPTAREAFARRLTEMGFEEDARAYDRQEDSEREPTLLVAPVPQDILQPGPPSVSVQDPQIDPLTGDNPSGPALADTATFPPVVLPSPSQELTPLRARQLVLEESGAARLRVEDLLRGTPSPAVLENGG